MQRKEAKDFGIGVHFESIAALSPCPFPTRPDMTTIFDGDQTKDRFTAVFPRGDFQRRAVIFAINLAVFFDQVIRPNRAERSDDFENGRKVCVGEPLSGLTARIGNLCIRRSVNMQKWNTAFDGKSL